MGTKNPGKIQGAKEAFEKYFDNVEIEGIAVDSEVGDQPLNEEISVGAKNRVKNLKKYAVENNIQADYYIASEAGITNSLGNWIDINAAVVEDSNGFQSIGISQGFEIPEKYMDEINGDEAIALKLATEGRSTKNRPDAENRGYGISSSKEMLVEGLSGSFFMLSGGAFHRHDANGNVSVKLPDTINWNGTIVLMRIPVQVPKGFDYYNYVR